MECKRVHNLIDAFLDAELDPLHTLEIESHLQECARCTALLDGRKSLQHALRTRLPYYTAPIELRRAITPRPARPWRQVAAALAACLLLAVGGLTWAVATRTIVATPNALLADAVESDHLRSLLTPEHLTDVLSTDQHTVKPWFVGKLPFSPPVHDLAPQGFPLLGGRLDVLNDQTVAALVYRRHKHLINLFIWPTTTPDTAPQSLDTARNHHLVHWTRAGMNFWAISDVEPAELTAFATAFRTQDTPASSPAP